MIVEPRTVLIVEDESDLRNCLGDLFEDEGYHVERAADGKEGLTRMRSLARPGVVLLDLIMPIMSGNEAYAAMQADPALASLPVIVMTSAPWLAPSGALVMRKPLDLERLLATVKRLSAPCNGA
jgi:CheY-like chemotaxis protein